MKYTDWRLPTVDELQTIVDRTGYNPAIDTRFFPDMESSYYWSSTTLTGSPSYAWCIDFNYGHVYYGNKGCDSYVCVVRAGQDTWSLNAEPRFTDNGDGTVTDNMTSLMWMQETLGQCTWYDAKALIEKLNKGE